MKTVKSPFYVVQEFISPLACEKILDDIDFITPDRDVEDREVKTLKTCDTAESLIYSKLVNLLPELQAHYELVYKGTERINFEWFPPGSTGEPNSENSRFVRGKWLRVLQRDLTAILFLSDYQDFTPFESEYEVYGGKLEFPQHGFSFQPQRGTLVAFPSDPHFINATSLVQIGDLYQARIQIAATAPYIYNPARFPGDYTTWFAGLE